MSEKGEDPQMNIKLSSSLMGNDSVAVAIDLVDQILGR